MPFTLFRYKKSKLGQLAIRWNFEPAKSANPTRLFSKIVTSSSLRDHGKFFNVPGTEKNRESVEIVGLTIEDIDRSVTPTGCHPGQQDDFKDDISSTTVLRTATTLSLIHI